MKTVFLIVFFTIVFSIVTRAHPIHVSMVNLDYIADSGKIEYSIKLFYDDFQTLINYKYNTMLNLANQSRMTTKEQNAVVDYVNRNFIILDYFQNSIYTKFTGWKVEDFSVWLFFCAYPENEVTSLTLKNTIMLDLFADQVNLVILHSNDNQTGLEFNKRTTLLSISL